MPAAPLTSEQLADAARLKKLFSSWQTTRRDQGLPSSQEAATELLGFNQSALSQYLNGKIPLNLDAAAKFAKMMDRSVGDFSPTLEAQVSQYSAAVVQRKSEPVPVVKGGQPIDIAEADDPDIVDVPLVRLQLRAGAMGYMADPEPGILSRIRLDRMWMEQQGLYPENLIALRVKGDSMSPRIEEGDIVVVNTADKRPVSGHVYAFNHGGEPLIKRLHRAGNIWSMRSDNPDYRPESFNSGESPIVGKVVYLQSTKI